MGKSVIKALGDFTGGNILYWPDDPRDCNVGDLEVADAIILDPRQWTVFDGRCAHETLPFTGTRFSLVYYISMSFFKIPDHIFDDLAELDVLLPVRR